MDPIEAPPAGGEDEITSQIIAGFKKYIQSISSNPANTVEAAGPQGTVAGVKRYITFLLPKSRI